MLGDCVIVKVADVEGVPPDTVMDIDGSDSDTEIDTEGVALVDKLCVVVRDWDSLSDSDGVSDMDSEVVNDSERLIDREVEIVNDKDTDTEGVPLMDGVADWVRESVVESVPVSVNDSEGEYDAELLSETVKELEALGLGVKLGVSDAESVDVREIL